MVFLIANFAIKNTMFNHKEFLQINNHLIFNYYIHYSVY